MEREKREMGDERDGAVVMSMLHEITGAVPRLKRSQRKGRGESSGRGKTCGRGTKGSKARVGKYIKRGYEGGQTQIFLRFPKRGFSNENFERRFYIVNVSDLGRFAAGSTVDADALLEAGLIPDLKLPVKILGEGELPLKLTVVAGWYSKSAAEKIAKAGGAAQNMKGETFEFPKPKKRFVLREPVKKQGKKGQGEEEGGKGEGGKTEAGKAEGGKPESAKPEGGKEAATKEKAIAQEPSPNQAPKSEAPGDATPPQQS
jgi:large subunit ribosomal protein L15